LAQPKHWKMDMRFGTWNVRDWFGGCGLDSTGSGQGPVAGCGECGDEHSGSCATELVSYMYTLILTYIHACLSD
jgi:hypothetical protein